MPAAKLVHTGKVAKSSSKDAKDAKGGVPNVHLASDKISGSMNTFNDALDDLESEIVSTSSSYWSPGPTPSRF